ncbi:hypothetical protein, partial [Pseudoxanthomonas dokdonensis]
EKFFDLLPLPLRLRLLAANPVAGRRESMARYFSFGKGVRHFFYVLFIEFVPVPCFTVDSS